MVLNKNFTDVKDQAWRYIDRGWAVLPINPGDKQYPLPGWSNLRIKDSEVDEYFVDLHSNIGLLLGEASGGLVDIDLDCDEALFIGPRFLPDTLMSGRGTKITHFWYVSPDSKSIKYQDIDGSVIVEIGSDGHQTVVEPSIHPSGDKYEWVNPDTEPLEIDKFNLRSIVARVAVSSLVARHLPDGGRHDLALAHSGLMLRPLMDLGEDKEDAIEYVWQTLEPAWEYRNAPEEALKDLYNCIEDTAEKIEADEPATGAPTLETLHEHGKAIAKRIKDWLGWGDLTPEEREEVEKRKRAKRAKKAWADEQVRTLAHDKDILGRVYEIMTAGGLVGEKRNAKLLTLVAVTMHLGRPMSLILNDDSSSGKSYLLKQLVRTLPDEIVFHLQSVSNMGLSQIGQYTLKHKFLLPYELGGLGRQGSEAIEQLKQLLTEGNIRRQIAESTNNGVGGRLVEVEGPTAVLTTSTQTFMDRELSNRMFSLDMDTSPEQTRRIIKARGKRNENNADYGPIRGLHTYLAGQDNRVAVPFEDVLTDLVDVSSTRMRRDHERIMDLIEAHAVLHQESRGRDAEGRIIATLEDYEAVHSLIADIVGEAAEVTVSETVRKTVDTVRELIEDGEDVTRNTLAARLGIVPTSAGRRFGPASAAGFVKEDPDYPNQKPKRYVLGDVPIPENVEVIPNPEKLRSCVSALGAQGDGTGNEDRAPGDFGNARSDASVHAPSSSSVVDDTQKPSIDGQYSDEHHDGNPAAGVSQNRAHARTNSEDEPMPDEKPNIVRAPVRGSCADDLTIANELAADGIYSPEEILDVAARLGEHFDDAALRKLDYDPSRLAAKVEGPTPDGELAWRANKLLRRRR